MAQATTAKYSRNGDRPPPHDADAERAVLGAVLRDPEVLDAIRDLIRADSFYLDTHQRIFQAVCNLSNESQPIDLVVLHDRLKRDKQLDDVGGVTYLTELWESVPTGANAEYHAKIVRDLALNRNLIHAATEILRDAYDRVQPADELLAQAEHSLFELGSGNASGTEVRGAADLARDALGRIDVRAGREGPDGLMTGYADLDKYLSGLKPGQLVVLGARPGCGKTALGLAVATQVAGTGVPVYFASLEMPEAEIMDRVLAMRSGIPMRAIQTGRLSAEQAGLVADATRTFGAQPFHLDDSSDLTAAKLASRVRRAVRRHGVRLVVVDYLQLLHPENPRDPRHLQVGLAARRVKQFARACEVPVILLCQLNREVESRGGKPKLSDLRESGEIEQHADAVLLIHLQPDQPADAVMWMMDVIVAKNRNGPVGDVTLAYRRALTRFENAAK